MNLASVKEEIIKDVARVFFAVFSLILVSLLTSVPERADFNKAKLEIVNDAKSQFSMNDSSSTLSKKIETKKKKSRNPSSI